MKTPDLSSDLSPENPPFDPPYLKLEDYWKRYGFKPIVPRARIKPSKPSSKSQSEESSSDAAVLKKSRADAHLFELSYREDTTWGKFDRSVRDHYSEYGSFSVNQAVVVLWRLRQCNVTHDPSVFVVRLSGQDRDSIGTMPEYKYKRLLTALTDEQKVIVKAMRR